MSYSSELDQLLPKSNRSNRATLNTSEKSGIHNAPDRRPRPSVRVITTLLHLLYLSIVTSVACWLITIASDVPNVIRTIWPQPHHKSATIEDRVKAILTDTPLIDGHNDLAEIISYLYSNHIYNENFTRDFEEGGMLGHVDLPRLKEGRYGGAFWSAFVECPSDTEDFSDENYAETVAKTYTQLDLLRRLQLAYPHHFSPPPNSSTALSYFHTGHMISPYIIEGLHQIGNRLSNLRAYHALGARYATLTWNCHNRFADSALTAISPSKNKVAVPLWGGVSPEGREVVKEMNRLGMIVDISHTSPDTMRDVLGAGKDGWEGSAAPVMFSHSSAFAICPHPRNVPDDVLHLVKQKNGIVMVNFEPDFISCTAPSSPSELPHTDFENATLEQVVKHVMYIGELIGYDHVGFGSDFDGIPHVPRGLEDVSKFPDLVAELLRQGVGDEDVRGVVGSHVLRVWEGVDGVAERMQREGVRPVEDALPPGAEPE